MKASAVLGHCNRRAADALIRPCDKLACGFLACQRPDWSFGRVDVLVAARLTSSPLHVPTWLGECMILCRTVMNIEG